MKDSVKFFALATALALSSAVTSVQAQSSVKESVDAEVMTSAAFLSSHPDLNNRLRGLEALRTGKHAQALSFFKLAARYADKPSQGMVAEMLWQGLGTDVDRPLAYAWMDLAAERQFKVMLLHRERYWQELSPEERERALAVGKAVYAEYGDDIAKPRLEQKLRKARRSVTGSRTGFSGNLSILIPGPTGNIRIEGRQFYQDKFWEPESYWHWQAESWKEMPKGRVEVGPLTTTLSESAESRSEQP